MNALLLVMSALGAMAPLAALGMTSCGVLAREAGGNITIESVQVVSGDDPAIKAVFWFDLTGPPTSEG